MEINLESLNMDTGSLTGLIIELRESLCPA